MFPAVGCTWMLRALLTHNLIHAHIYSPTLNTHTKHESLNTLAHIVEDSCVKKMPIELARWQFATESLSAARRLLQQGKYIRLF